MKNTCKKLSALMLALLMLISAAACTNSGDSTDTTDSNTSASDTGTGTDTQAPDTGCTATLPAACFVILALLSAAVLPRRDRRNSRR